jgi:hypothetical protein
MNSMKRTSAASFLLLCIAACARTTNLASNQLGAEPDSGLGLDGGVDANVPRMDAGVALCGNQPCACSNNRDDDGDGFIDGFDAECTGPYDQDEGTFATGATKDGNPHCVDCFFDSNGGSGDDGCLLAVSCSVDGTTSDSVPACNTCTPSSRCVDSCLPRTPNGCDCFGCCELNLANDKVFIRLTDTCSLRNVSDTEACPRCTVTESCFNPCGRCELCPGKTLDALPSDCAEGDLAYTCEQGTACGDSTPCGYSEYCVQGCCVPVVF